MQRQSSSQQFATARSNSAPPSTGTKRADARRPAFKTFAAGACAALVLSACAVGPDFKSPDDPAAKSLSATPLPEATAATPVPGGEAQRFVNVNAVPTQWWQAFQSSLIDARVAQAFEHSPTVASAQAALRQARENLAASRGGLLPSVDGQASAQRQKSYSSFTDSSSIFNLFDVSAQVNYTLDLFGGIRRGIEAQSASLDYQRYELAATYQTLAANVVTSSVQEASLRAQLVASEEIIRTLSEQLNITEKRYQLGGVAYSELLSARANLASQRAQLPDLQRRLTQTRNQVAVYLGQLPADLDAAALSLDAMQLPQALPLTLPSQLARQRPDVQAAEALLHQASANVGVATANLFPQITLSGQYGSESARSGDLFSGDIWSVGANLTQPIFRGGELTARRRAAVAAFDQARADYKQTVLTAFQNVADTLRALETDAQALQARYEADSAADQSLKLIETQYRLGGASYLSLLNAQQQYQQAHIAYVQALASRYADTAALYQALGGGALNAAPRTDTAQTGDAARS